MSWKPINPFQQMPPADTPAQMRSAIEEAQRHNPLVRNVLTLARRDGLKGEDVYTMMAYRALQMVTRLQQQLLEDAEMAPPLPVLVPSDEAHR